MYNLITREVKLYDEGMKQISYVVTKMLIMKIQGREIPKVWEDWLKGENTYRLEGNNHDTKQNLYRSIMIDILSDQKKIDKVKKSLNCDDVKKYFSDSGNGYLDSDERRYFNFSGFGRLIIENSSNVDMYKASKQFGEYVDFVYANSNDKARAAARAAARAKNNTK